jgi:hypothetical protein
MRILLFTALLSGVLLAAPSHAQGRLAVELTTSPKADDVVGQRLAYLVKEELESSHTLQLTYDQAAARTHVYLVTLDPTHRGEMTVFSVTVTFDAPGTQGPIYLGSSVASVGLDNVEQAAQGVVAEVSQNIDAFRASLQHQAGR